ncbi:hypothetical protein [Hyphobacterium marinum]|uniref:NolW-like domain-containing protein n=1 Tax=Hyphobacterium marinum TaxID=3116574 RepID=A0ABU7M0S9_9PROT|nr:hypothetical protein [Hyphobacterium sp. Y6023]MEE2567010.1 hypothetical protein [Hyphobacterium sp. Y6023]
MARGIKTGAVLGLLAGSLASTSTAADPIRVEVEPGRFATEAALVDHVHATLRGVTADIRGADPAGGVVLLDGDEAAARALRADPVFLRVAHDGPEEPRLRNVLIEISNDGATAEPFRDSARPDPVLDGPTGWPGEVVRVDALAADGAVIATVFVRDPRFVRYEGWNPDGSHETGSNRSFVDDTQVLDILVALPAEAERVVVYDRLDVPEEPDGRRRLGDFRISEAEDAQ